MTIKAPPGTVDENVSKNVKTCLTVPAVAAAGSFRPGRRALTELARKSIVPPMTGLNHSCGICREIIS
jgi:hypothetical protein